MSPKEIVLRQIDAYNDKQIDVLRELYSSEIKVYRLPQNDIMFSDLATLVQHVEQSFCDKPNQQVEVLSAEVCGDFVSLKEKKTIQIEEESPKVIEMLSIYHVEGGQIRSIWIGV